jgi:hypothetical protein
MTPTTKELEAPRTTHQIGWVAACTLLSWLGAFFHNRADLPQLPVLSPESSIPALISLLLFLGWWLLPQKRTMRVALLSWVWLNLLVGGILSVLPFPFWPFHPEQTVFHYLMHAQYTLTQIPLVVILLRQARRSASGNRRAGGKA